MSSHSISAQQPVASQRDSTTHAVILVPRDADVRAAANDDEAPAVLDEAANPLWVLVIAMAIFFAVTAIDIALS